MPRSSAHPSTFRLRSAAAVLTALVVATGLLLVGSGPASAAVATGDVNSVTEDLAPNPVTGNVLINDTDVNAYPLSVTSVGTFSLSYGFLVINADGTYRYTLDNANLAVDALDTGESLSDTFTYSISNGHGGTDTGTLTITIKGTTDNRPPVTGDDSNSITKDAVPDTVSGNVLTNDSDPDGHPLSVVNAGTVMLSYGQLVIHADGSYQYTLDNSNPTVAALGAGSALSERFTVHVSDGRGEIAAGILTITINGAGTVVSSHTVAFDSTGGTAISTSSVDDGDAATQPTDPTRAGYAFTGWYTDADLTTPYDFTAAVTEDLILYAGWSEVVPQTTTTTTPTTVPTSTTTPTTTSGSAPTSTTTPSSTSEAPATTSVGAARGTLPRTGGPGSQAMLAVAALGIMGGFGLALVSRRTRRHRA